MDAHFPDCLVEGYEPIIDNLQLPDVDDRHVLAAAIRGQAEAIITFNLKDFPASILEPFGIQAIHPDEFLSDMYELKPSDAISVNPDRLILTSYGDQQRVTQGHAIRELSLFKRLASKFFL